ncbi:AAA family ATPase [Mumia qirimensis]|uniref:AAA family ATPase n=1 Tax=Mumia qirimensis TaxID=3234852 RepID=UPI00351D3EBE
MNVRTPHGLIIGKFYPPHAGHHLLIRTAAAVSHRVTVLVLDHPAESIPVADRVAWLREVHRDDEGVAIVGATDPHPVDYEDPDVWDLHVGLFRDLAATVTPEPVTAVFSSEPYGEELARRLGARPVAVDPDRVLAPISATAVRQDPVTHWESLAEPVRGALACRVVVVGAESTGTTTVALALRDALRARGGSHGLTRWVPEHGRDATVEKLATARAQAGVDGIAAPPTMDELVWRSDEFVTIARTQNALEDAAARLGGPVLVCDTDAFATGIWHERYEGTRSAAVEDLARHHPLYLLTDPEGVPFVQDGLRDGEGIRDWMTGRFVEALEASGRPTVVLKGSLEQRVADGLAAIDALLAAHWRFAAPVTPVNGAASL